MIVYNITNKVMPAVETAWVKWQQTEHIPEIMATGLFVEYKFYRLLNVDESEGITYIVQYFALSMEQYTAYINQFADTLRKKALMQWGNQFIAFRTLMQSVD
jgi:Domain of unknown function (DUF4286)